MSKILIQLYSFAVSFQFLQLHIEGDHLGKKCYTHTDPILYIVIKLHEIKVLLIKYVLCTLI